jgi:LmbE family N-acetylglucosaminyl deacetylase
MKWVMNKVLVLSPHTDDMELGAGGFVRLLRRSGAKVKVIVFSDCKKSVDTCKYPSDVLRKECEAAAKHIGIQDLTILEFPVREFPKHRQDVLETIYKLRKKNQYDLVLTSWNKDLHQDHKVVAEETLRAFMKTTTTVLSYEIPGNCPGFTPHVYVPLSEEDLKLKVDMLHCYKSQVDRRGYFEINAIRSLMGYQGNHIGVPYAEAFVQQRMIVKNINDTKTIP